MRLEINPLYPLSKRLGKGWYEFPEGRTYREILEGLGFTPREIREMRVAVGGKVVDMEGVPEDGSTLVLMATLAGG